MKTMKLKLMFILLALAPMLMFAQETATKKLSHFYKVDSRGSFDVELKKGNEEKVKIVAKNFPLEKIIVEVRNETLVIKKENDYWPRWGSKVKVYVVYKELEGIKNGGSGSVVCHSDVESSQAEFRSSGSGSIKVNGTIKADHVEVSNSGSGGVYFNNIEAKSLSMGKSGSGSFRVSSGNVDTQELSSSGSGSMALDGVNSKRCRVKISGSGSAKVSAEEKLKARISGSGSIYYRGNPTIDSSVSGSGKVRSM